MRIIEINTSDGRGGANKFTYGLKKELEKRGHQTDMFVGYKYSTDKNVHLLSQPSKLIKFLSSITGRNIYSSLRRRLPYLLANDIDLFPSSNKILETPQFQSADVIHCNNLHSNYFQLDVLRKMAQKKPIVWTLHDMWAITAHCAHAFDGQLKEGFFTCPSLDIFPPIAWHNEAYLESKKRKIYKNSPLHIVVPSRWLKEKVEQSVLGDKKISLIYNGIDTNLFKPYNKREVRMELGIPLDKKVILSVMRRGQSNPWKGGEFLNRMIENFKDNKDIIFVCLGGGEQSSLDSVKNAPYITDDSLLAKYYSAADILLYPSIADNCPLVVLEAQAAGLPVVAFATGGIPEIMEHQKTGYIAAYKDFDNLLLGVNSILNLPGQEYERISTRARELVLEKFSLSLMVDNYINLFKNISNA